MPITRAYTKAGSPLQGLANPVINGGFDIWQRGTSIALTASNVYTADRWTGGRVGGAAGQTISRQSVGDSTNLPNIQYAARSQRASGNTSTAQMHLVCTLETANSIPFAGKTITFSYYARRGANYSQSNNALDIVFETGTGTDQSIWSGFTGLVTGLNTNVTLATTWQRFAHTISIPSTATQIAFYFRENVSGTAGADDWFEVTGVQIDIGTYTAATAPEFRRSGGTLAGEFQACQRYYQRYTASANYSPIFPSGYVDTSTSVVNQALFPVKMRTKPSSVEYANARIVDAAGSTFTISAISLTANVTDFIAEIQCTVTGATGGRYCYIQANNNAGAYVGFSAEL